MNRTAQARAPKQRAGLRQAVALGALVPLLGALGASPAWAQAPSPGLAGEGVEAWGLVEVRMPWAKAGAAPWVPSSFRLINDLRNAPRVQGFQHALARGGPVWNLSPEWALATNLTAGLELPRLGTTHSEYRVELEPTWRLRSGAWSFVQRGRGEWRMLPTTSRLRLRWQGRLTWHPEGWPMAPFVSQEAFFEPAAGGYNQNRLQVGTAWPWRDDGRVDLGYLWRPRLTAEGWQHDHAIMLTLFLAPDMPALMDDEAGD